MLSDGVDPKEHTAPRLYRELAEWMPLVTAERDYRLEASIYRRLFLTHDPNTRTVLELGCGAGNNAYHLKRRFDMTLVDVSPEMLELCRTKNPGCEHVLGDMRSVRLHKQFDAVFIHDAISYMTTLDDLSSAIKTAFEHCKPGGQLIIQPDFLKETFREGTSHGGNDGESRSARYLQWIRDPDPNDSTYVVEFALFLARADGSVSLEHDTHLMGVFSEREWFEVLCCAGFCPEIVQEPFTHEGFTHLHLDIVVGRRQAEG